MTKINTSETIETGKAAVAAFMAGMKAKLNKAHTVEEAVNDADAARVNAFGRLNDLLNTYDSLGLHKAVRIWRECIENSTVNNKTSLLMLGRALDIATDKVIADIESDVQFCIDEGLSTKNALESLAAVRCLKNNGNGHSVWGALVRCLLYIIQATINKVSRWLGLQSEGTLWCALGKAIKCFAGLVKVGVKITYKVGKTAACYIVSGATKLGQLFMSAFYLCVGAIVTWKANRGQDIEEFDDFDEEAAEAAAEELFQNWQDGGDFEAFEG